jgi:hypothetical protein
LAEFHSEFVKVMRRLFAGLAAGAILLLTAAPAFAHDCFNPNKPEGAGVNHTITAFTDTGPVFVQTGSGQGIGGFVTIAAGVVAPGLLRRLKRARIPFQEAGPALRRAGSSGLDSQCTESGVMSS